MRVILRQLSLWKEKWCDVTGEYQSIPKYTCCLLVILLQFFHVSLNWFPRLAWKSVWKSGHLIKTQQLTKLKSLRSPFVSIESISMLAAFSDLTAHGISQSINQSINQSNVRKTQTFTVTQSLCPERREKKEVHWQIPREKKNTTLRDPPASTKHHPWNLDWNVPPPQTAHSWQYDVAGWVLNHALHDVAWAPTCWWPGS